MQFGKSLVGALVGGAVGIAALILIYMLTGWDKAWLAILVAIITGAGVRWAAATKGYPSYARGALTALVAILAFLAWYPIQAQLTVRGARAKPIVSDTQMAKSEPAKTTDEAAEPADAVDDKVAAEPAGTVDDEVAAEPGESAASEAAAAENPVIQPADDGGNLAARALPKPRAEEFSTWDFLWLCIAGLIAYELGRGTASAAPSTGAMGSPDDGPPPVTAG
jgi:hypothetical protein